MSGNKKDEKSKTTEEIVQEIITRSGNGFHTKVAQYFRERDWTVRLGQYYVDAATDKPRELDLVVERVFQYGKPYRTALDIHVRLIVECKYIPNESVFWIDAMDTDGVVEWIEKRTPLNRKSTHINDHHYLRGEPVVAKLFASESREESDPIFKALNQCLSAFVSAADVEIVPSRRGAKVVKTVVYPVIIFNYFERFHQTSMAGPLQVKPVRHNFRFEAHYAYRRADGHVRSEYMLVDMVSYEHLDAFITSLVKEVGAIREISEPDEDWSALDGYQEIE